MHMCVCARVSSLVWGSVSGVSIGLPQLRSPQDHINMMISRAGSGAQYEGKNGNRVFWDPSVYVWSLGPFKVTIPKSPVASLMTEDSSFMSPPGT